MKKKIWHTPDGVRDILGEECEQKASLEERLGKVIRSFGYRDIETPTFEYYDVFGSEVGTTDSSELYKFFDRDGHTLVLRPDITPSIARAAARFYAWEKKPVRLCYRGNTFVNHSSYQGRLKESTQVGAELIGDSGPEADAEMVAMVVRCLKSAGLKRFQVTLGNARFFDALCQDLLPKDEEEEEPFEEELRQLLHNRNSFGVESLLLRRGIDREKSQVLSALPTLSGGPEILSRAAALASGCEEAIKALDRLQEVLRILKIYGVEQYILIDLGMISQYMYYTGILFRAYTYGTGEAVVKGGRYDQLLGHFGKEGCAVGFVVVLGQLMNALRRQHIQVTPRGSIVLVLCPLCAREEGIRTAEALRAQGEQVELRLLSPEEQSETDSALAGDGYQKVILAGGLS